MKILVFAVFLLSNFIIQANECEPANLKSFESARINQVYDGDTILLEGGRKVRLLGINAPELNNGKSAEPFSHKAKKHLQTLVLGKKIYLVKDVKKTDKYSRLLAHIFLANGQNVVASLLKNGFGKLLIIPPNIKYADCYYLATNDAKKARNGLFGGNYKTEFFAQTGKLNKIKHTPNSVWLYLQKQKFVRINRQDLAYFAKICFPCLLGKKLRVLGWWRPVKNAKRVRLYHPLMMEIIDE